MLLRGTMRQPKISPVTAKFGAIAGRGRVQRRLAAIMGLDVSGYSRMMARDDEDTHQRVGQELERVVRHIRKAQGSLFSFSGDGLMAEFPSAVTAVRCALRVQADAAERNATLSVDQRIQYRIGLNSGEIVIQAGRPGGHAVNIAARLEQMSEPGAVCLSRPVYDQVSSVVPGDYRCIGDQVLKNIPEPVTAYVLTPPSPDIRQGEYRPSLAVIPFRTLQPDQDDAYFAAGMVDDIVHTLAGLRDLVVIARNSTEGFAGSELDPVRAGKKLHVRYLLHGSVRRAGNRLRISAELCETEVGLVLWSERFEGASDDLFALQDQIAVRVAGVIAPQVRDRELRKAMRKHPTNMTAYDFVLQAMDVFYRMRRDTYDRAYELLQAAIAHDPSYAPAWSNCAYWHIFRIGQGWSPDEAIDAQAAARAASAALERDANDAQALAIYGHMQSYLFKDFDRAVGLFDRAMVAGPNCALAWCLASLTSGYLGDGVAAVQRAEHALRLSPMAPDIYLYETVLAQAYYVDGRYNDAALASRRIFDENIGQTSALRLLIASLVAVGHLQQARLVAQRLITIDPKFRLETFRDRTPLMGEVRKIFIERLKIAGLQ